MRILAGYIYNANISDIEDGGVNKELFPITDNKTDSQKLKIMSVYLGKVYAPLTVLLLINIYNMSQLLPIIMSPFCGIVTLNPT